MQVAPMHARVSANARVDYPLAARAASICGPAFSAHLGVWHEALAAQVATGGVPDTYLVAMRQVVASEAAAGSLDEEDAVAAAVALECLGTLAAKQAAKWLLQDLYAIGYERAGILHASIVNAAGTRASQARGRLALLGLKQSPAPAVRVAALCLLGDSYLLSADDDAATKVAYRFYMAAAREASPAAGPAHLALGKWYEGQGTAEGWKRAVAHYASGSDLGCSICLRSVARMHEGVDADFVDDLSEIADIEEQVLSGRDPHAQHHGRAAREGPPSERQPRESILDSVRGLFKVAFA